jgi:hypothetical protein
VKNGTPVTQEFIWKLIRWAAVAVIAGLLAYRINLKFKDQKALDQSYRDFQKEMAKPIP